MQELLEWDRIELTFKQKLGALTKLNEVSYLSWRICGWYQNLLHIAIFLAIHNKMNANVILEDRFYK